MAEQHVPTGAGAAKSEYPVTPNTQEIAKQQRERLVPKTEEMRPINFGINLSTIDERRNKAVDMGGNVSLRQQIERSGRHGEQINLDHELYERVATVMDPLRRWIKLAQESGRTAEEIARLTPLAQVTLADFEDWEKRAREIEGLLQDKKADKKLLKDVRIFHSGEEVQRALAFLEQSEILASHALGYELTNGGRDTKSFLLTNDQITFLQKSDVQGRYNEAFHAIAQALHLSDSAERHRTVLGILTNVDAVGVGIITGFATGNPWLGLAVGGAVGVSATGAEIMIGNWVLSLPEQSAGEGVNFQLRFNPNLAGSPNGRLSDNPIGELFLGRSLPNHVEARDFLVYSDKTRHAIFSRLGLRVESIPTGGNFNWNHLSRDQRESVRRLGRNPDNIRGISAIDRTAIENAASFWWLGGDLGLVDINPLNMGRVGYATSELHWRVRQKIQTILEAEYKGLPKGQISADVSYRDFSNLTPAERHKIMIKAYDMVGADICSTKGAQVLERLAKGGEERERSEQAIVLETRAGAINDRGVSIHPSKITDLQVRDAELKLARQQTRITELEAQGNILTSTTTDITKKEEELKVAEEEIQRIVQEVGDQANAATGATSFGKVKELEDELNRINTAYNNARDKLGLIGFETTGDYPQTSIIAQINTLESQLEPLDLILPTLLQRQDALSSKIRTTLRADPRADVTALNTELSDVKSQIKEITDKKTALRDLNQKRQSYEAVIDNKDEREAAKQRGLNEVLGRLQTSRRKREDIDKVIADLRAKKAAATAKIEELTRGEDGSSGRAGIATKDELDVILAHTKADLANLEKKYIDEETFERTPDGKLVRKSKAVSKEDKELAEGMTEIARICKTEGSDGFNKIMSDILLGRVDLRELASKEKSYDVLLKLIFGSSVLDPEKAQLLHKILTKSGVVDAVFEYLALHDMSAVRTGQFFALDAQAIASYQAGRTNRIEIRNIQGQIVEIQAQKPADMENRIKILETRLHELQDANVRLFNNLFDNHIAPTLGEHRIVTAEIVRSLIDRMRKNALDNRVFADSVQFVETIPAYSSPDGSMLIREPRIDPVSGAWISGNSLRWDSPQGYQLNGQNIPTNIEISVSPTQHLGVNVEMRPQNLEGLLVSLPDNRADITPGSPVYQELQRRGLLPHLYNAAGTTKNSETQLLTSLVLSFNLPAVLPDETDPTFQPINAFLNRFGLHRSILDNIYPAVAAAPTRNYNVANTNQVVRDLLNRQIRETVLRVDQTGFNQTDELAIWLVRDIRYPHQDTGRIYRSLAGAIAENSASSNNQLLGGTRFAEILQTTNVGLEYRLINDHGELRMFYLDPNMREQSILLRDVVRISDQNVRTQLYPGLTNTVLNETLVKVGRNVLEAIRQRTP